jgi:hypothetical protein
MAIRRIDNFGGLVLTKDPKKGPFWTAMKAQNCDIQSGSVDVAYSLDTANLVALTGSVGRKAIYNIAGSTFLEWSQDVDVVRSPLADNSSNRVYYTGDDVPKATDYAHATGGVAPYPSVAYVLGVPVPALGILALSSTGGTDVETRAYTYTLLSAWGEEGAPAAPSTVSSMITGATVQVEKFGVATRGYTPSPLTPVGIALSGVVFIAGAPGFMQLQIATAAYYPDFRPGNRVHMKIGAVTDYRYGSYVIGRVDNNIGTIDFQANIWENSAIGTTTLWRVLPINSFNLISASSVGTQVEVFVDVTDGLRATEKVTIAGAGGMTDLNATFAIDSVGTDPYHPSFRVTLTTAQVYTSGGRATRTSRHNTGETRITNMMIAAGVVTVTLEHVGGLAIGDQVVIIGAFGSYQANGLRTITGVNAANNTFTFALAAMGAYSSGGVCIRDEPFPFTSWALTNAVASGGVYPAANIITITFNSDHTMVIGDIIQGYDIGGAVELNTMMKVATVPSSTQITCNIAGPMTAFTIGGRIVKVRPQFGKRIYRTGSGTAGAEFQLVAEVPGDVCHYVDTLNTGALGAVMESDTWIPPPIDMFSLLGHPHGFLVGSSKNILCFSEPYQPHAWPLKYQLALPADVVGCGIYGTTVVAFTKDVPINVQGYTPAQMTRARQDVGEPCTSKRSVISTGLGVLYRGTSGMYLIGYEGSDNATKNYLPASNFTSTTDTLAAFWGNKICWIDNATKTGYLFDPVRADKGLTEFAVDFDIYDLHVSPVDGLLWASYLDGSQAKRAPLFRIVTNPAKFTYWTQHIQLPKPVSFGALKVEWDWHLQGAALKDREAMIIRNLRRRAARSAAIGDHYIGAVPIGGDELETVYSADTTPTVPTERFLKVTVIAEPNITDKTTTVFDDFVVNDDPVRISNGIKSDVWQVKLIGNAKVSAVSLAEDITEFDQV